MQQPNEFRPSNRITCINHLLRAHEAFESALAGDQARYQTLLLRLESRSLAWLRHLIETRGVDIPAPRGANDPTLIWSDFYPDSF